MCAIGLMTCMETSDRPLFVLFHQAKDECEYSFQRVNQAGDQHAAHLIQELKSRQPEIRTEGFGGPEMRQHGCEVLFELTQLAVMGFLRILPMLAKFRRLVMRAERHFEQSPPDAVVLVDFPGFNWWIARAAKKHGIPVFYYMPPQLWAWAPWRIRKVRKWVDHVICALPFEYDWYSQRGVAATWVGHPFFDEVASKQLDASLVNGLRNESSEGPLIGVLPGSRDHEIERNFPAMLDVIASVSNAVPGVRWVIGNYSETHTERCRELQAAANSDADLTYFAGRTSEVIEAADACFMVSGSISLELLARRTPGIVLYRISRMSQVFARLLMTCRYITLTNLIAEDELMPEFVSSGNPVRDVKAIAGQLTDWSRHPEMLAAQQKRMSILADKATITGASGRTAELLLTQLDTHLWRRAA